MASVSSIVRALIDADQPVLLWGQPGTGKTSAVLAMAKDANAHVEVLIGSTLDPLDVGGYLVPTGSGVVAHPPPWARRIRSALDAKRQAWLFLDELSCAPSTVQAALLRVVQDRAVGELSLDGCRMLAAANPEDTAADRGSLSGASANRWAHIDWNLDVATWVSGELSGWGRGAPSVAHARRAADVAGYIQKNPSALLSVPEAHSAAMGRAWPSPRSWSAVIRSSANHADMRPIATALVGRAAASELAQFLAAGDLPDPEELLSGKAKLPTRPDTLSRSLLSVVSAAATDRDDRPERVLAAWKVLSKCRADVALVPARVLLDVIPTVPPEARELGKKIIEVRNAA